MSVDHALEYPQSPPCLDIPLWSENYIFQGSCPDQGILFYQNIGRVANNPTWWRSMFNLVLPDGNIVTARTYGRGRDEEGPRTVSYTARCVAPMSQWRLQYDGFASVTTQEQNAIRYLSPVVPPEPFEFDALWHGDTPVWDPATSFYYTLAAPSELIPGYDPSYPSYPNPWALRENMCAFDLDGEAGIGFLEISRRHA